MRERPIYVFVRIRRDENGLVLMWMSLFLIVMLGCTALAVDLGHAYFVSQNAQNAADAVALAGAPYLPGDLAGAQAAAQQLAAANGFTDGVNGVKVTAAQGADPSQLTVTVEQDVPTWFAKGIGFNQMHVSRSGTAVADQSSSAVPVDLMVIIDRTGSMNATDVTNVKNATKDLLTYLNPANVHVALGMLGPSGTTTACSGANSGAYGLAASSGTWIVSPYPNAAPVSDYQNADGTINTASQIVKTVNCLNTSSVGTNLGTPIQSAQSYFSTWGRVGARQGIIFMTDGEANQPNTQSCKFANNAATSAKAAGIEILTIGFGVSGASCADASTPTPSPYPLATVTQLLSDMASPVNGVPSDDDLGCTDAENHDGDDFFCEPKSGDLSSVFLLAATKFTQPTPRLVK